MDASERERLIVDYLPLAKRMGYERWRRALARGFCAFEIDDYQQMAAIGLIRAAREFDPGRGVPFAGYAAFVMRREIPREMARDMAQRSCGGEPIPPAVPMDPFLMVEVCGEGTVHGGPALIRQEEARGLIRRGMRRMKPSRRRIVELRAFDGLSNPEIAARMGWTTRSVAVTYSAAMVQMREQITMQEAMACCA